MSHLVCIFVTFLWIYASHYHHAPAVSFNVLLSRPPVCGPLAQKCGAQVSQAAKRHRVPVYIHDAPDLSTFAFPDIVGDASASTSGLPHRSPDPYEGAPPPPRPLCPHMGRCSHCTRSVQKVDHGQNPYKIHYRVLKSGWMVGQSAAKTSGCGLKSGSKCFCVCVCNVLVTHTSPSM